MRFSKKFTPSSCVGNIVVIKKICNKLKYNQNTSRETDLAWIIHGVVIANGFTYLVKVKCLTQFFMLIGILGISIMDWHLFYKIDNFFNKKEGEGYYPSYLWMVDYTILACYAILFQLVPKKNVSFFIKNLITIFKLSWVIVVLSLFWWGFVIYKFYRLGSPKLLKMTLFLGIVFYALLPIFIWTIKINLILGIFTLCGTLVIYSLLVRNVSYIIKKLFKNFSSK